MRRNVVMKTMATGVLTIVYGSVVGFCLGLTGGGGSMFAVPLLVYGIGLMIPGSRKSVSASDTRERPNGSRPEPSMATRRVHCGQNFIRFAGGFPKLAFPNPPNWRLLGPRAVAGVRALACSKSATPTTTRKSHRYQ